MPTLKFELFVQALDDLCREHGVTLSVSDYDGLQVWPAGALGESPIHSAGIEDKTEEAAAPDDDA